MPNMQCKVSDCDSELCAMIRIGFVLAFDITNKWEVKLRKQEIIWFSLLMFFQSASANVRKT